jgi:hypothetical protein
MKTMKIRLLLAVALVAFVSSSTVAGQKPDDVVLIVFGSGAESCGKYVMEYEKKSWLKHIYVSWVQGYLTGKNVITKKPWDTETLGALVYNYCKANPRMRPSIPGVKEAPITTIHVATVQLLHELEK